MNNIVKNSFYTTAGVFLTTQSNFVALATTPDTTFGVEKSRTTGGKLEDQPLSEALQTYVNYIMTFLALIALFFILWGGFLMLTAAGDEEKVSKGKTILIQRAIGLIVIFLAGAIVKWIISLLAAA